jgi:purine-nucleoside phosphorylase
MPELDAGPSPSGVSPDAFALARRSADELAAKTGVEHHDVAVVLGTALGPVATLLGATTEPIDLEGVSGFSALSGHGHRAAVHSLRLGSHRVLLFTGRLHHYEGKTPAEVVHGVRTAAAMGCTTFVLTNAAGGIRPDLAPSSVVIIDDHLNLTGRSPLEGIPSDHHVASPFIDLCQCWSPRLRRLALEAVPGLPSGVYAQMPGPHLETPAEIRMLANLGADLVGMSTVFEAIAARHLGAEVLGLSAVTNAAAGLSDQPMDLIDFVDAAALAAPVMARVIVGVIEQLDSTPRPT